MSQRKKTPDILGDLLGSKPAPIEPITEPVKPQNVLPVKQQAVLASGQQDALTTKPLNGLTSKQQDVLPVKQQRVKTVKVAEADNIEAENETSGIEAKTKITFYLSEDSVELLEDAQRTLRRMAKKSGKVQPKGITSKSALLEEALKLACADLEAKGDKSRFASLIA